MTKFSELKIGEKFKFLNITLGKDKSIYVKIKPYKAIYGMVEFAFLATNGLFVFIISRKEFSNQECEIVE